MKEVDRSLIEYLVARAPNSKTTNWLKDQVANYENAIACYGCNSPDVKITVDTGVQVSCNACGKFSTGTISLDKIPATNYNAVSFLQEKKIIEILEAQSKI